MSERGAAVALVSLLTASWALALDRPIDGAKLVIQRRASREKLVFVSRDPAFLFPSLGGADDPTAAGAAVDLFSPVEGSASLPVPAGVGTPGWTVTGGPLPRLRFRNSATAVTMVVLKQNRLLKVVARVTGLPLGGPQGAVGIRVRTGDLRNCARFDGATIQRDEAGRFVARGALASAIPDCSDQSLTVGTTTTTPTSSTTTTTTAPPCGLIDVGEPICAGKCPAGATCVAELNPGIGIDCVCLPDGTSPCAGSGYPACGGGCTAGRVCQAFHILPGEGSEFTGCACADPGNTCADPPGTCFAIGVCPPGQVCAGMGPPTSVCGCEPVGSTTTTTTSTSSSSSVVIVTSTSGPSTTSTAPHPCGDPMSPPQPLCWGECPATTPICAATVNGCECVPGSTPCGSASFPQCDGACGSGESCVVSPSLGCTCQFQGIPCSAAYALTGSCGGVCPQDHTCVGPVFTPDGDGCLCVPIGSTCHLTCGADPGAGNCPSGESCGAFIPGLCLCQ